MNCGVFMQVDGAQTRRPDYHHGRCMSESHRQTPGYRMLCGGLKIAQQVQRFLCKHDGLSPDSHHP